MKSVIDLHVAECIEALDVIATKDSNLALMKTKSMKLEKLCVTAEKVFKYSQSYLTDQERTYIFLRRFLQLYETILSLPHCDKQYVMSRLNLEVKTAQDQFTSVKCALENRYQRLKVVSNIQDTVTSTPKTITESKQVSFTYKDDFITCRELYHVHLEITRDLLIMDTRPSEDYANSRMKELNCINIPEETIKEGLSANLLGKALPEISQVQWNNRHSYSLIVLVDAQSTPDTLLSVALATLKDILLNWDLVQHQHPPVVLHGGYADWVETYPMFSTNPQALLVSLNSPLDELLQLDDVNYPSMVDKSSPTVRTQTRQQIFAKPFVDRATKPVLHLPSRDSLLKEEQLLVEQQLKIESELVALERNLAEINKDQRKESTVDIKQKTLQRIEDLEKSKIELEEKYISVRKQIELFASFNPVKTTGHVSVIEGASLEFNIQNIEEEKNRISDEREALMKKREDLLQDDGKNKVYSKIVPTTPVRTLKRKMDDVPQYNRMMKPIKDRDFRAKQGKTEKGITGLQNIGNICYLNSIIQCLSNTIDLTEYFCLGKYREFVNSDEETCGKIAIEFGALVRTLWNGSFVRVYAVNFKDAIAKFSPRYRGSDHQDAHELLQSIINWLHDELRYEIQMHATQSPSLKAWNAHFQNKSSIILDLFFFQLRTERTCSTCQKSYISFDTRQDIMVDVPNYNCTLEDCLKQCFKPETVTDFVCGNCKVQRPLYSITEINTVPTILIITLKRYATKIMGRRREFARNNCALEYPLDLQFGGCSYNLYAICEHTGTLEAGHYTATCFNITKQRWVHFNDEHYTLMGRYEELVINPTTAYILFYSIDPSCEGALKKFL